MVQTELNGHLVSVQMGVQKTRLVIENCRDRSQTDEVGTTGCLTRGGHHAETGLLEALWETELKVDGVVFLM